MFDLTKNYKISRTIASQGMVLLKNENETLPLTKNDHVGIVGKECLDLIKGGGGSAQVNCEYVRTMEDGLSEKVNEGKLVLDTSSLDMAKAKDFYTLEDINTLAKTNNKVVVTYKRFGTEGDDRLLGEKPDYSHHNHVFKTSDEENKRYYYPSENELYLFDILEKSNIDSVILLLNISSSVDISFLQNYKKIKAVLLTYLPGMECGTAIADVLCGDVTPCGKLVDTIAKDYSDYPTSAIYDKDPRLSEYKEGIYVGYRYFETFAKDKVLYPFGYGLSYTTFAYANPSMTEEKEQLHISVDVTNTGVYHGREIVEIYVEGPKGAMDKPSLELKGYEKTKDLLPGETEHVSITINKKDLASFDDMGLTGHAGAWVLESGDYKIYVAKSIRDITLCGVMNVPTTMVTEQLSLRFQGQKYQYQPKLSEDAPNTTLYSSLYDVEEGKLTLEDFVNQLDKQELINLSLGQPLAFPAGTSGLGNIKKRGIPNPQTADGPAGIRRSIHTTCFPCGICIASSWDKDLQFEMGKALGFEGYSTGLDVILGPAMNIHRDPLGGRCFEYFSEDPLISGKTAASIVNGIQSEGLMATLKHFAANSCEYYRNINNSIVSERTLREIYLKGFEIAVKESKPAFIMTSYNLLNGTHTSANIQLLRGVLRDDWGYEGATMTDWRNGVPLKDELVAGNNIKMPYGYPDEGIKALEAHENKMFPISVLKENAYYVLKAVMKTRCFHQRDFGVVHHFNEDTLHIPPMEVNGLASSRISHATRKDGVEYLYRLNREQRNQRSFVYYVINSNKAGKVRVTTEISTNCPETQIWYLDENGNRLGTAYCDIATDANEWYKVYADIELKQGENFIKMVFANEPYHDYEYFCPSTEIPNAWPELAKEDIFLASIDMERI